MPPVTDKVFVVGPMAPATKRGQSGVENAAVLRFAISTARRLISAASLPRPYSSSTTGVPPKVFVQTISAPASKYALWTPSMTSGRTRFKYSWQPSSCSPPKSSADKSAFWIIVPMAPSMINILFSSCCSISCFDMAVIALFLYIKLADIIDQFQRHIVAEKWRDHVNSVEQLRCRIDQFLGNLDAFCRSAFLVIAASTHPLQCIFRQLDARHFVMQEFRAADAGQWHHPEEDRRLQVLSSFVDFNDFLFC